MLIIACDTSGTALSAAIWRDEQLVADTTVFSGQPHSVTLMPLIEDLLQRTNLTIADADAFACAVGPGSYTGIRIGVSAIKALAYATGKPAIGISTLEAMAWPYAACPGLVVCPMIDARNHRVYAAAWQNGEELIPAANFLASDFVSALQTINPASILLVGLGQVRQPVEFFASCGKAVLAGTNVAPAVAAPARAAAIAELAAFRLSQGAEGLPQQLLPQYLSPSQAERQKAARDA